MISFLVTGLNSFIKNYLGESIKDINRIEKSLSYKYMYANTFQFVPREKFDAFGQ